MNFLENLRMNNIFGGAGSKPSLGMPDFNSGSSGLQKIINQVYPLIRQEKERDRRHEMDLTKLRQPKGGMQQIAETIKKKEPMDVVYRESIDPYKQGRLELDKMKLQQTGELQREKLANADADREVRQQRANVYEFKAKNPNLKFDFSGPTVIATNPLTGEVVNTGMRTGSMSEADRIALQQDNALSRIDRTGEQARKTEETRQGGRETLAETRGWKIYNVPDPNNPGQMKAVKINEVTGDVADITQGGAPVSAVTTPSGGGGTVRPENPTQTKVRQFNLARHLYNSRPELRPFITIDETGSSFRITPPNPSGWTTRSRGPSADQFAEINKYIYEGQTPVQPSTTPGGGGRGANPNTPAPNQTGAPPMAGRRYTPDNPPPAPQGWKYVPKPGGGWTAVPVGGQ